MIGVPVGTAHYVIFAVLISAIVALYLGVIHREPHVRGLRESVTESLIWLVLALAFAAGIMLSLGPARASEFGYGFFVEGLLSLDNLLIFSVIFSFYGVPEVYQSFLLAWSVLITVPARGLLVALGSVLLTRFGWLTYLFGGLLILAGLKYFLDRRSPPKNRVMKAVLRSGTIRRMGLTSFDGKAVLVAPLVVVATVETVDALAAMDSVSASYTVSHSPFVVFTSNVLAALMLRSLYFVVNSVVKRHQYLTASLAMIAVLIGSEMIAAHFVHVSIGLAVLLDVLTLAVPVLLVVADRRTGGLVRAVFPKKQEQKSMWPLRPPKA